jgi:hypothetical protein
VNNKLDLTLEVLEALETPVTDREAGLIAGAAFGLGIVAGALIVVAIT